MSNSSVFAFDMWEEEESSPHTPNTPLQLEEETEQTIFDTIKGMTSFASLLRIGGAMIVLAAMSAFLMQDWAAGNDISRYTMLLSQTLLLAMGGFGLSYLMKENKGARVFFGLGLVSITVNMATLGALIFSMTQWGSTLVSYPGFAKWQAMDVGATLLSLGATLAVSLPVAWFSYKVLARHSAKLLVGLGLFGNLLLLLPVRESVFVGALAIVAILVPLYFIRQRMQHDNSLRTAEGWFAIATIFVPAAIIIFRSLWLYPVDEMLTIALAGTTFAALRFCTVQMEKASLMQTVSHWISIAAALMIAVPVASLTESLISEGAAFSAFGTVFALLALDIAQRSERPKAFVVMAALVAGISFTFPVIIGASALSPILCVLAGVASIVIGREYSSRAAMVIGGLTVLAGAAQQMVDAVDLINFSSWITLAITGASIIVAASIIERHGAVIKLKWQKFSLTK